MTVLLRNYKVRAIGTNGDSSLLVTESRERALGYYHALASGKHWAEVRIELGVETYSGAEVEKLP